MKNLKKSLALVLAIVMVFSLCIFANAAFADQEKIGAKYEEATSVMNGLGILKGDENGVFDPQGNLTRGQACKIIAYMKLGTTLAEKLTVSAAPFKDVKVTDWAAPFIAYCKAQKIVSGYGDGNFGPEDKLTGYQFGKMLLVALGYGANGEFEGEGWEINVTEAALAVGIYPAATLEGATENLISRELAAQLAFNGLNYSKTTAVKHVVKDTKGTTDVSDDTVVGTFDTLVEAYLVANSTANYAYAGTKEIKTGSLGVINYGLTKTTKTDDFGRESVAYTNGMSGLYEVVYAKFAPVAVKTYTTAVTNAKLATDLGAGATPATGVSVTVITDGAAASATGINKTTTGSIGGQGTLIEVYKTGEKTYDVIVINTYVRKLVAADITKAAPATAFTDAVKASITLNGLTYYTDAFKVNDVVIYTKTATKIVSVAKAESVVGKVNATAAGYIRVDGNMMLISAANVDSAVIGTTAGYKVDAANEYTYYLDSFGNIVKAEAGVTAPVAKNYTYVIAGSSVAGTSTTSLFETTTRDAAAKAQIIDLATGEIKIVDIAVVKGTGANTGKFFYADEQGKASATEVATGTAGLTAEKVYEYSTLADGTYVFGSQNAGVNVTLQKGVATGAGVGKVMTSATVVNVVEYTKAGPAYIGATVTTTTGIANFPVVAANYTGAIVVANPLNNIVTSITIVKEKAATTATTNYAIYDGVGEFNGITTNYAFYVGGERVEYSAPTLSFTKGDVVSYTLTNGKIANASDVSKQTALASAKVVTAVDDTFVACGSDIYYFAKTGVEVYDVITKAPTEIAVGDTIAVYGTNVNNIAFVLDIAAN